MSIEEYDLVNKYIEYKFEENSVERRQNLDFLGGLYFGEAVANERHGNPNDDMIEEYTQSSLLKIQLNYVGSL